MTESVVVALITGAFSSMGAIAGAISLFKKKSKEDAVREAAREARQAVRLDNIEKKLDDHNHYAEKFGEVQKDLSALKTDLEKDIAVIKNDIEHMRKEKKYANKSK